jgi:hypothetical protein
MKMRGELQIKSRKFKLKSENVMERKLINENKKKCFRKIPVLSRGLTFLIQAKTWTSRVRAAFRNSSVDLKMQDRRTKTNKQKSRQKQRTSCFSRFKW